MTHQEYYVDTDTKLHELLNRLETAEVIGFDTEFVRERTYYPRLCLLQVGTVDTLACIDPLAVDIEPLLTFLDRNDVTKVVHSGRQDMEIVLQAHGSLPRPVFDTQLAAALLGFGDQVGYAPLVEGMLGVSLEKGHTRTDWCHRPLEEGQVRYALDDVRYLPEIHRRQVAALSDAGRLQWLEEDFAALAEPDNYRSDPFEAWRRIKGNNKLKGAQRAVLRRLAAWREREAESSDRPRRWVVRDEALLAVAQRLPGSDRELARIRGIDDGLMKRHSADLLSAVRAGLDEPQTQWPEAVARHRLTPSQDALVDAAMAVLRLLATAQNVSMQSLAGRRDLEALIAGERDLPLLHGWRRAVAGADLLRFLEGESTLGVREGELALVAPAH